MSKNKKNRLPSNSWSDNSGQVPKDDQGNIQDSESIQEMVHPGDPKISIGSPVSTQDNKEWYPGTNSNTFVHAALPNTLRSRNLINFQDQISINDETVRIYDRFIVSFSVSGRTDGFPCQVAFFLVKGPNGMTWTNTDGAPTSGVKAVVAASCSGGSEIIPLKVFTFQPVRENGAWVTYGTVRLLLTKRINRFIYESSNALAQGRTQGKLYLVGVMDGAASTTDTVYCLNDARYHLTKRRLVT